MQAFPETNLVHLCGSIAAAPEYSHTSRGQDFFRMPLEVLRLSGTADRLNLILRREQLAHTPLDESARLAVIGELRSFNNRHEDGPKLVLTVFVRELAFTFGPGDRRSDAGGEPALRPLGLSAGDLLGCSGPGGFPLAYRAAPYAGGQAPEPGLHQAHRCRSHPAHRL